MTAAAKIQAIYRYPVKGLSPEPLHARAARGRARPCRATGSMPSRTGRPGFDPALPRYQPKTHYLMLMRNERLATLKTRFDEPGRTLVDRTSRGARPPAAISAARQAAPRSSASSRASAPDELRGPPKVLHAPGFSFSDVARKVVSIINLASVAALEDVVGAPIDPLRFRANVYVTGWPAWRELDLVGREIAIGADARLKVVKRIVRCAATNVDPDTGIRDLAIPDALQRAYGHADCGVYAEVVTAGEMAVGDGYGE